MITHIQPQSRTNPYKHIIILYIVLFMCFRTCSYFSYFSHLSLYSCDIHVFTKFVNIVNGLNRRLINFCTKCTIMYELAYMACYVAITKGCKEKYEKCDIYGQPTGNGRENR